MMRQVLNDLKGWLEGGVREYLAQLNACHWQPINRVVDSRNRKIEQLLAHSASTCSYYREVLGSSGTVKNGVVSLDRFDQIPLLDKATIRSRAEGLISTASRDRKQFANSTGGSTGEPVSLIQDNEYVACRTAGKLYFERLLGYRRGDPRVKIWGAERDLFLGDESLKLRLAKWLRNEVWLNALATSDEIMAGWVHVVNERRPRQILAYAESAYDFARYILASGSKVASPDSVVTTAGTLFPAMRATIEEAFGCSVYNWYGSREVGDIACERPGHRGLVCNPLTHYVEVLDEDGKPAKPGESGEIVVTLLTNFSMPLIRYRIGDTGYLLSSDDEWPVLGAVEGRSTDRFVRPDGGLVHGGAVTRLLRDESWLVRFQSVQPEINKLIINYVQNPNCIQGSEEISSRQRAIENEIHSILGDSCLVEFNLVESISPSSSGKHRYNVSLVDAPHL